jgi:tetratricopeptide (TPR) repeat protein
MNLRRSCRMASKVSLALSAAVLPWCLGGAPAWSSLVLWLFAAAAALAWLRSGWHRSTELRFMGPSLIPLSLAALGLFQCIPWPDGLLHVLSAPMFELKEFALVPLGLSSARAISFDVPATARSVVRLLGLAVLCATAAQVGQSAGSREKMLWPMAISGALLALCGFGHAAFHETALFGVHKFVADQTLVTPFGNVNHAASFLTLCCIVSLGLASVALRKQQALGWAAVGGLCSLGVLFTFSRGGIASLLLGVACFVLWNRTGRLSVSAWLALALAGLMCLGGGWVVFERMWLRLDTVTSLEKLKATKIELWPNFFESAQAYWVSGMGLGAFEHGFTRFQHSQFGVIFTHPENILFQSLNEVGFLGTALVALLVAWCARRILRAAKEPLEKSMVVAVAAVFVHEVFDFSLELNAVSAAVALLTGLAAAPISGARKLRLNIQHALGFVGVLACAGLLFYFGVPTHLEAEAKVARALQNGDAKEAARSAIARHPADYVFYSDLAANAVQRQQWGEALASVNRVLYLRPFDVESHIVAARALAKLGRAKQAVDELRAAWALGDQRTLEWGLRLADFQHDFESVLLADPEHLRRMFLILRAAGNVRGQKLLLEAAKNEFEPEPLRHEAQWLELQYLFEPAQALVKWPELPAELLERDAVKEFEVRLLLQVGRLDEAASKIQRLTARSPGNIGFGMLAVSVQKQRLDLVAAHEALTRLRPFVHTENDRTQLFVEEANLFTQQQRWQRAIESLQTALRVSPQRADVRVTLSEMYEKSGQLPSALIELRRRAPENHPSISWGISLKAQRLLVAVFLVFAAAGLVALTVGALSHFLGLQNLLVVEPRWNQTPLTAAELQQTFGVQWKTTDGFLRDTGFQDAYLEALFVVSDREAFLRRNALSIEADDTPSIENQEGLAQLKVLRPTAHLVQVFRLQGLRNTMSQDGGFTEWNHLGFLLQADAESWILVAALGT